jgi:hypothetical protein
LAVFARLSNAVTLAAFLLFLFLGPATGSGTGEALASRLGRVCRFLIGGLPVGLFFLLANWLMFGSPFTTSYDRWQHFVEGQVFVSSQSGAFYCSFFERIKPLLFDAKSGLLIGAPLILLAVAFGLRSFWRQARNEAIFSAATCALLIAVFTKYCNAVPGEPGNRYLMPVVALCAVPLSYAIRNCFSGDHRSVRP